MIQNIAFWTSFETGLAVYLGHLNLDPGSEHNVYYTGLCKDWTLGVEV